MFRTAVRTLAINRSGRSKNQSANREAFLDNGLQQSSGAGAVGVHIATHVVHALSYPGLSGEVVDRLNAVQCGPAIRRVAYVSLYRLHPGVKITREWRAFTMYLRIKDIQYADSVSS
jgi:hypothetical protein